MPPPSFWPTSLVDYAQILSAIATAAAVIVTLWVSSRQGREHIRGYVTVSLHSNNGDRLTGITLKLNLINVGTRPMTLEVICFNYPQAKSRWSKNQFHSEILYVRGDFEAGTSPELQYGQHADFFVYLTDDHLKYIDSVRAAKRIKFTVDSLAGKAVDIKIDNEIAGHINRLRMERKNAPPSESIVVPQ